VANIHIILHVHKKLALVVFCSTSFKRYASAPSTTLQNQYHASLPGMPLTKANRAANQTYNLNIHAKLLTKSRFINSRSPSMIALTRIVANAHINACKGAVSSASKTTTSIPSHATGRG
jgi:hypothetical protein